LEKILQKKFPKKYIFIFTKKIRKKYLRKKISGKQIHRKKFLFKKVSGKKFLPTFVEVGRE